MIALSLFFATAIWSLGSLVLTCVNNGTVGRASMA